LAPSLGAKLSRQAEDHVLDELIGAQATSTVPICFKENSAAAKSGVDESYQQPFCLMGING
jgi:hypothetical protein